MKVDCVYLCFNSVVTSAIMRAWAGRCGPTCRQNTAWKPLATRAWIFWRGPWRGWTPVVTGNALWRPTPQRSPLLHASTFSHTWETRSHATYCPNYIYAFMKQIILPFCVGKEWICATAVTSTVLYLHNLAEQKRIISTNTKLLFQILTLSCGWLDHELQYYLNGKKKKLNIYKKYNIL